MTLNEINIGQKCTVLQVGGDGALRQHFLDMGLIPGAEIKVVKYAPMGDPIELRIHGYELTLRLDDAKRIEVDLLNESVKDMHMSADTNVNKEFGRNTEHPGLGEGGRFHLKKR